MLAAIALVASGCASDTDSAPADTAESEADEADEEPESDEPEADEEAVDGAAIEEYLLRTLDVDTFQELPSDHWGHFIVDVEGDAFKTVRITMQLGQDDPEAQGASETIFSLIGGEFPNLEWVEIMDGAGVHIEQTKRSDVPLLNL